MDSIALSDEKLSAILAFLVTFGYADGLFDVAERQFVSAHMGRLAGAFVDGTTPDPRLRERVRARVAAGLDLVFRRVVDEIEAFMDEGPRVERDGETFLFARLKVRCVEHFRAFAPDEQKRLLELLDAFILADGRVSPEEKRLRELLVATMAPAPPPPKTGSRGLRLWPARTLPPQGLDHPFLAPLEQPFSPHPVELASQLERDHALLGNAILLWKRLRERGEGRLRGLERIAQLPPGAAFLDGHVHVQRVDPVRPLELVVLGDLHGCYSCLKGALLQSNFLQRVWLHQWDPVSHPDVKLVLLGDYIDRGRYGLDGVLRTVLQLLLAMPDHVIVLRGNHESFVRTPLGIRSGVFPAEAIAQIAAYVPPEMLDAYRIVFESMPAMLLCERTMIVHGGIPRDDTFELVRDLASLNHPDVRFQMMWSDPVLAERVPLELQRETGRFSFGHRQFRAFMERTGFETMIRGHEKIDEGFRVVYDLGDLLLLNLFSAGGAANADLPLESSYRKVTPMALTLRYRGDACEAWPWPIDWRTFNAPARNGFLRGLPELPFFSV
jgi:hypothetical protein